VNLTENRSRPEAIRMLMNPMTQEEFDQAVRELKLWVNTLHGVVQEQLPEGLIYDPEFDPWMSTGDTFKNPRMEAVAKGIMQVMGWYDFLQERLGLPAGQEPRFQRFLSGRCR
jgi:hypothetical protein